MISIRLLIADPNSEFRDQLANLLTQNGFLVTLATTLEELRAHLRISWFHLVILNVHMRDPNDPHDTCGIEILHDEEFRTVPKFVVADHPTVPITREVLKPDSSGSPLAVDFLGKDSGIPVILEALQDAVEKHIRINWALRIRQKETTAFIQLAHLIYPQLSNVRLAELADELEGMTRGVFLNTRQVTLGRILFYQPGYVIIEGISHADKVQTMLLAYSQAKEVERDPLTPAYFNQFDQEHTQSTTHFIIRVIRLQFSPPLRTFKELYTTCDCNAVIHAIEILLSETFARWHNHQQNLEAPGRFEEMSQERLGFSLDHLETKISEICKAALANGVARVVCNPSQIAFYFPEGETFSYPHPAAVADRKPLITPSSPFTSGLSLGRVSGSAFLLDSSGQSWLIDGSRTGIGPILLDFVALEMIVRIEGMGETDLAHRYILEQLLTKNKIEDEVCQLPEDFTKGLRSIRYIRQAVKENTTAYTIGLFYTCLSYLTDYQPQIEYTPNELTIFTHLLLLAAMLGEQLTAPIQIPTQASESLWIDPETKEVWVEGRFIELTPQDLAILVYLYQNPRQRRSRQQIINAAFGNQDQANATDDTIIEESRLNSAMSRLRLKIESDPENPKYLHTIRGYGYRLDV